MCVSISKALFSVISMSRPKVLVTNPTALPQLTFDLLGKYFEVILTPTETKEEVVSKVKRVDAIVSTPLLKIDKEVLVAAGDRLKVISTISVGYDHVDVGEVKMRGIKLGYIPHLQNGTVASHAVLLALAASRRLHEARLLIDNDRWKPHCQWVLGQDIAGSTVGIIGLGGIGQAIIKRLKAFDVDRFIYTGRKEKEEGRQLNAEFVSLDTLARESDFVIVSCPLTADTEKLCDEDFFSKMKETAVFVNISRGQIVDQDALIKVLSERKIFAAGLDVATPEPLPPTHELLKLPNVVILPHLGGATVRNRETIVKVAIEDILRGLQGEKLLYQVN